MLKKILFCLLVPLIFAAVLFCVFYGIPWALHFLPDWVAVVLGGIILWLCLALITYFTFCND